MIVVPSTGQLQIPGSKRSFARVLVSGSSLDFVGQELTVSGEYLRILPDAGYLVWEYEFQGARRWGKRLPIQFQGQFIPTDIAFLPITRLIVVLRLGVSASVSIRRADI